ncbi:putative PEP-binding protein [Microcoleus sp. FACHB-68]|uniref:putative PEP-binding protein n=1 Tax=Microcoleus sp. FACHB-68 TaxID=2692826 RepID=UPI001684D141|nr:putative PEP-binding protein [Microcoleus sp. FACHB-68]MBD1936481.1 hypothetical protein [Microcoleus sp. FACHB-68]
MPWRVCLFAGFAILLYRGVGWVFLRYYAGIWVEVCGELASSPLAMPVLLGLGVDELSVSVPVISTVKVSISHLTMGKRK